MQIIGLPKRGGVSIEIGDRSIRFVEIASKNGVSEVVRFGELPLAAGVVTAGMIVDPARLATALKNLRTTFGVTAARALLPHGHTMHLRVRIPGSEKRYKEALARSLALHTGEEKDAIVSHVSALARFPEATEIHTVVTSRAVSEAHTQAYAAANIRLYSLASKTEALVHALVPDGYTKTVLVVDIEHTTTAFCIVDAHAIGGVEVALFGADNIAPTAGSVASHARVLCDAIRRMFLERHLGAEAGVSPVEEIVLSGVGATIPGLAEYLSVSLRLPVRVGGDMDGGSSVPVIPRSALPAYVSLVGLGQSLHQHGSLLSGAVLHQFTVAKRMHTAVVTLLVGAIVMLFGFIVWLGVR